MCGLGKTTRDRSARPFLARLCRSAQYADGERRQLSRYTSNGNSLYYACEYAMVLLDGDGSGMTRLPHTFLSASCACLAGIGLPSK
jgi:hypothetical protein